MNKEFVMNVIVYPLIIAVGIVAVFLIGFFNSDWMSPITQTVDVAYYQDASTKSVYKSETIDNVKTIKSSKIPSFQKDMAISKTTIGKNDYTICYDASDLTLKDNLSLLPQGNIFGEVGCAYVYGYKNNIEDIVKYKTGDIKTIYTDYSTYKYKCVSKFKANSYQDLMSSNPKTNRGLILFTDETGFVGLSGKYDCVKFEMVSGAKIVE